jgi:predicted nucleotide-binding protein
MRASARFGGHLTNGYVTNPVRYFHVRLFYYTQRSPPRIDFIDELNKSEVKLEKEILEPLISGEEFLVSKRIFQAMDVAEIKISGTPQPLPITALEEFPYDRTYGGSDVTEKFIQRSTPVIETKTSNSNSHYSKNIFIVHGRNHRPMEELRDLLNDFNLNPIVLKDQPGGGSVTLVEKLEKYTEDLGYAFVILTPEDIGGHKEEIRHKLGADATFFSKRAITFGDDTDSLLNQFEARARQNAIFEMGYLFALVGRSRVCCLLQGEMQNPTDIDGVEYKHFNESILEIKAKIIQELKEAGYEILEGA